MWSGMYIYLWTASMYIVVAQLVHRLALLMAHNDLSEITEA